MYAAAAAVKQADSQIEIGPKLCVSGPTADCAKGWSCCAQ